MGMHPEINQIQGLGSVAVPFEEVQSQIPLKTEGVTSIILKRYEKQFLRFGNFTDRSHQIRMEELRKGTPYQLLEENPLARRIVRGMLIYNKPASVYGAGGGFESDIPLRDVLQRDVFIAMNEMLYRGFLCPIHEVGRCSPTQFVFSSEVITISPGHRRIEIDPVLRKEIGKMLSPLEMELLNRDVENLDLEVSRFTDEVML